MCFPWGDFFDLINVIFLISNFSSPKDQETSSSSEKRNSNDKVCSSGENSIIFDQKEKSIQIPCQNPVPTNQKPIEKKKKLGPKVIVCSGLNQTEMSQIGELLNAHGSKDFIFQSSWSPEVTHVIVKTKVDRLTDRTLKYLNGVASGCWVLIHTWVTDSLTAGRILSEVSLYLF